MQVSLGQLGTDKVFFVKPNDAIELVKIATLLGFSMSDFDPKQIEVGGGKPKGSKNRIVRLEPCSYCGKERFGGMRKRAWRHICKDKRCVNMYQQDTKDRREGNDSAIEKRQLVRNLQASGLNVTRLKR